MNKHFIAVQPTPDPADLHIPGWVMPVSSILFSVVATSVTITFFLSRLQSRIALFDEKVSGEFKNILLKLEFKDENIVEIKCRLDKLETNFTQLTRYVNRGATNTHPFTARNTSSDDFQTFS